MPEVFITAAEMSGDQHAAAMIRALRELDPTIHVTGIGGQAMRDAGAQIHFESVLKARFGVGSLLRAAEVRKMLEWTKRRYRQNSPALHVCVDSFTMNYHFAKIARDVGVPVLYYIPPQLWASRPGRLTKLKAIASKVACILPFEKEKLLRDRGVDATFVGHPLFDHLKRSHGTSGSFIGLLAGSRKGEALGNFGRMLEVVNRIKAVYPDVRFLCPTTASTDAIVREMTGTRSDIEIQLNAVDEMVPRCRLCLVKSGTATLQVAAHGVPMVIVYYINPVAWSVGKWLLKTHTFGLINLLAGKHVSPEFIPWYGGVDDVAKAMIDLWGSEEMLANQRRDLQEVIARVVSLVHRAMSQKWLSI